MYISRVAELNTDGSFDAVGEFERLPIDLEELVMTDMESAVETLGIYIGLNDIAPLCTGATDEEGKIEFNALEPGLYLVCGEDFVFDGYTYSVDPVLLFTPSYDNSTGEWIYETVMAPKFEGEPEIPVELRLGK